MIKAGELAYADAFFGLPGGSFSMNTRRLGIGYLNGDPIRYAPDLMGRGLAAQNTLARRPLFLSGDLGAEFINGQVFELPQVAWFRPNQRFSFYMLVKYRNLDVGVTNIRTINDPGFTNCQMTTPGGGSTAIRWRCGNDSFVDTAEGAIAQNVWHVVSLINTTANTFVYVDGVQVGARTNQNLNTQPVKQVVFGALADGANPWNGVLRQIVFFNYAQQANEVLEVATKIRQGWGLSQGETLLPPAPITEGTLTTEDGFVLITENGDSLVTEGAL